MKTRTIMIIALTIAMLSIIFGVGFGVKKSVKKGEETTEAPGDSAKVAKRVFNLIILDESGSMQGLEKICVDGVNETIQTIRLSHEQLPDQQQLLTFLTFSSQGKEAFRTHLDRVDITEVTEYKSENYRPSGGTPLYDAMGFALTRLEVSATNDDIVLVTVITDGYENASTDFDSEKIKALIDRLDKKDWVFTYIGANQDAVLEAGRIGIRNALNYDASRGGTKEMWERERSSRSRFMERARTGTAIRRLKEGYFNEEDK